MAEQVEKKIIILPRYVLEDIAANLQSPHAVITIADPKESHINFPTNPNRKDVLFLKFYDIDFSDDRMTPCRADVLKRYGHGLFTDEQADQILDFIEKTKDKVKGFIINCGAGVSRSAGTGAAISLILNGTDKPVFNDPRYIPNMFVYRKILDAWQRRGG